MFDDILDRQLGCRLSCLSVIQVAQMFNRGLDSELAGFLSRLAVLQVVLVPGALLLDRRGPALGVAAGSHPANSQRCPAKSNLVGPTRSQCFRLSTHRKSANPAAFRVVSQDEWWFSGHPARPDLGW